MADQTHIMMSEYLRRDQSEFGGKEKRIKAWVAAVKSQNPKAKASKATWHRYMEEIEVVQASPRPARIVLERNAPPDEFRPFDSPVGSRCDLAATDLD